MQARPRPACCLLPAPHAPRLARPALRTRAPPHPQASPSHHVQAVREAFLAQDALAAVVGMLAEPLARHPRMDEKDAALVQLVIAFLK